MGKIATAQITIADLSDPIISGSIPSSPVEDMLWLDTSVSPNVLKRYNNGSWSIVNDTSNLITRITTAEQKITDDAIVSTVTNSTKYLGLEQRVSTAENKLTADAMETTISNSTALSNVKQTADKINWIIASGDSASTMQLTDDALTVISRDVTISADKIKITSGDQIDSSVINGLDLTNNTTVKDIKTTADEAKTLSFVSSDTPPASSDVYEGYRWLDTGVTPSVMRVWKGADISTSRKNGTVVKKFTYHAPDATSWTPSQSGSGTASPTNIRPLNPGKDSVYFTRSDGIVCKATFASTVYGGSINSSGVVTRTWGYIELSGNESWEIYNSSFHIAYYGGANYGQGKGRGNAGDSVFSHGGSKWTSSSPNCNVDRDINLQGFLSTYSTVDALKTYLKSEKAAGHPLEVAYYLSTSQTVSATIEPYVLTIDNTKGQIVSGITIDLPGTATADTTVYVNGTAYTIATGESGITITDIEKTTYDICGSTNLTISYDANGWETVNDTSAIEQGVSNAQSGVASLAARMDNAELELTQDKIVSKVTSSETYKTLDGQVTTNKNNISTVTQTANKIEWIVADDATASAVKLTSNAYKVIADSIDLSANTTVKITSAGQISAEASKGIDISANESITLLSGRADTIEDNINTLEDDSIYDSADIPTTVKAGMKWLDRGVIPAVLRRWTGATTTPAGNTMTTDREIAEDITGTSVKLYNTYNLVKSRLDVTLESSSASKVTVSYGNDVQTVTLTNGYTSIKLKANISDQAITTTATSMDVSYICSGWETVNDTSDLENDLLETANTTTNTYNKVEGALELTTDGVRVGRRINGETVKRSVLVHSSGMDICTNNVATSEFRDDYIKLLGMQIRVPTFKGGLIISAVE